MALSTCVWQPFCENQAKSATSATVETVQMMEKNASYRKPKGKFRTKQVAKNLKCFSRKLQH